MNKVPTHHLARAIAPLTEDLSTIGVGDIARFGGKNASLGEMMQHLGKAGVQIPRGFALSAQAYKDTVHAAHLDVAIAQAMAAWRDGEPISPRAQVLRARIKAAPLPRHAEHAIAVAYRALCRATHRRSLPVAVRSSATAEDLPHASFAGQQESFLNVRGAAAVIEACRACIASLFTDRAIAYRETMGFAHDAVALSVGIQEMVDASHGASGVIFTRDPDTGFPNVIEISAAWGLGETIVQGLVEPDRYRVFKPLLSDETVKPVIEQRIGTKISRAVYARDGGSKHVANPLPMRMSQVLEERDILLLARQALAIERHYHQPMDIEWARDGKTGDILIVQARPLTACGNDTEHVRQWHLTERAAPLLDGHAVGHAIACGEVRLVRSVADLEHFPVGAVLVASVTDPDWVPAMRRAAAIVTDHGGPTSHAAIVARELGVPALVGTNRATQLFKDGDLLTIACAEGEVGHVYKGRVPFTTSETAMDAVPHTRTRLMVNLADPAKAMRWWRLPAAGVGLARIEFIVADRIRAHPLALQHPEKLTPYERRQVERLCRGYASGEDFFVTALAEGIACLAAVFHPHPAIVRFGDFKSNEYAGLLGGRHFEPREANPMLGLRGASRYYHEDFREAFALECRALRLARDAMGLTNIIPMIPFCRNLREADLVLDLMRKEGLRRGEKGLKVYVMAEIPANVILAEDFAKRFDGFSIGSNDLTQLVLGVDRDSVALAALFDEQDPAVTQTIADLIARVHAVNRPIGICGQAPSDHPAFARFLIETGIDSISLNPDSFIATLQHVAKVEEALAEKHSE
ncbi:MAG: phosphoenolpyruvate synthase [Sphingomonadales bacterium]|nr:phosphoenolpyruvate synthase [Sphingomonadales bacterium]MDE2170628.1 phosphoenolpyruvate synthase [Sphingomonadales bacterium]